MVMDKKEIAPGIFVYSNVIKDDTDLIKEIEETVDHGVVSWSQAYVRSSNNDSLDTKTRDTMSIGIPYLENPEIILTSMVASFNTSLSKIFFDSFSPIEADYKNHFGIYTTWHDSYGILKYGVGQKFTNHIDDHPDFHRRVSMVYYMNDNYEGGEINFPRFNVFYKPLANEMLVFPSTYVYNHSVNEVTSGTRYAVVSWAR
jgi:hypothetical protein